MAIRGDTTGQERGYLLDMLPPDIGSVLEIGCGDGRLTRKYAERARHVVGIDLPRSLPGEINGTLGQLMDVAAGSGVALPFRDGSFDQAVFSLSF